MQDDIRSVLADTLQLGARAQALNSDSGLLGSLPELDSMAVVAVITALEERFGIVVDDDEITADTFATLGTLTAFVTEKVRA
jgi:acyl carrier protein